MKHTVIGFFENPAAANEATGMLLSSGFSEKNIDTVWSHTDAYTRTGSAPPDDPGIETPYDVNDESRYEQRGAYPQGDMLNADRLESRKGRKEFDAGSGDSIGRFFRDLFDNREEAEKFATAGRSNCIVSVQAFSSDEAEKAADILDQSGALDITEQPDGPDTNTRSESPHGQRPSGTASEGDPVRRRETIRVRAQIIDRPVGDDVRLREERVYVDPDDITPSPDDTSTEEQRKKDESGEKATS